MGSWRPIFPRLPLLKCPTTPMARLGCAPFFTGILDLQLQSSWKPFQRHPSALPETPMGGGSTPRKEWGGRLQPCMLDMLDMLEFLRSIIIKSKQILDVAMQNQFVGIHVESNLSNQRFLLKKSSLKLNVIK